MKYHHYHWQLIFGKCDMYNATCALYNLLTVTSQSFQLSIPYNTTVLQLFIFNHWATESFLGLWCSDCSVLLANFLSLATVTVSYSTLPKMWTNAVYTVTVTISVNGFWLLKVWEFLMFSVFPLQSWLRRPSRSSLTSSSKVVNFWAVKVLPFKLSMTLPRIGRSFTPVLDVRMHWLQMEFHALLLFTLSCNDIIGSVVLALNCSNQSTALYSAVESVVGPKDSRRNFMTFFKWSQWTRKDSKLVKEM